MSFVSVPFFIFFPILLVLLLIVKSGFWRKILLFLFSIFFYLYWDWRSFLLIFIFSGITYFISLRIYSSEKSKTITAWLVCGVVFNLLFLGFFKYYNFFIDNINALLWRENWEFRSLQLIVPIGISFITFGNISYLVDIKKGASKPAKNWLDFALFVSYFPKVISGPIVRASQLLPQWENGIHLKSDKAFVGLQIILRGCIKKLLIADSLTLMTNQIFASPSIFSSITVWIGIMAYSIEIYLDFSGYTDMAIGVSKVIGIDLPQNFNLPYTSLSITEFWRRWHISLSTWFRDYVFFPLERIRSRRSLPNQYTMLITLLVFFLTGLWHGASWNFVLWGGIFGFIMVVERMLKLGNVSTLKWSSIKNIIRALITFTIISVTWVLFRAPTINIAQAIFNKLVFINSAGLNWFYSPAVVFIPLVLAYGYLIRLTDYQFQYLKFNKSYSWALIFLEFLVIFFFATTDSNPFIYSRF